MAADARLDTVRKLNLNHLSEEECESVLKVIQRDFELRQGEKDRINKLEEEVEEEQSKAGILAKQKTFNDNCCMRCFSRFVFLFNSKVQCYQCRFNVCKNCSEYDKTEKDYICKVCLKQKETSLQAGEWFYNNVKKKFKRFGSAKVVRSLYKRKTESEESDYAMSDSAIYGTDKSTGKRNRPGLTGAFEMDLDTHSVTSLEKAARQNATPGKQEVNGETKPGDLNSPYTCRVVKFEQARDTELAAFRVQLEAISQEVKKVLETQATQDNNANTVSTREEYEKLVDNQKLQLSERLSQLSQSLHIAIDNQTVGGSSLPAHQSPTAKHQLVRQTVLKECQQVMGRSFDLKDEDITSEYGSESGTEPPTPKPYEDMLADAIVKQLISEHVARQTDRQAAEEREMLTSFTKVTNKATVSQLNEELQGSELDTTHDRSLEGVASSDSDSKLTTARVTITTSPHTEDSDDDDLDALVTSNLPVVGKRPKDEENEWLKVESRQAAQTDAAMLESEVFTTDIEGRPLPQGRKPLHSTPLKSGGSPTGSDHTLLADDSPSAFEYAQTHQVPLPSFVPDSQRAETVDLDDISRQDSDLESDIPDEPVVTLDGNINFGNNWTMNNSALFRDKNIISAYDNFGEKKVGRDSSGPTLMLVPQTGEPALAKIGDLDATDVSDLSENEASSDIELDSSSESDSERGPGGEEGYFDGEGRFIVGQKPKLVTKPRVNASDLAEHGVQTDDFEQYLQSVQSGGSSASTTPRDGQYQVVSSRQDSLQSSQTDTDSQQEVGREAAVMQKIAASKPRLERPPSPEVEDVDPKFVMKPEWSVSVMEGEPVTFQAKLQGSDPIDVFWYKDLADIVDLADDDRCDVVQKEPGHFVCQMFNTERSDAGAYLCVGINEVGQCSRTFQLQVTENKSAKSAPEFIKPLQDVEIMEGESLKLRCKVKGYPQPRVQWYRDGKLIKKSNQYRTEKFGNRDYVLAIDYVTLEDDAEFSVVASNVAGEARSVAQVIVEEKPEEEPVKPGSSKKRPAPPPPMTVGERAVYPGDEELLRLAEEIQSKQGDMTDSAQHLLHTANTLSRLHASLEIMESSLEEVEADPMLRMDDQNNNEPLKSVDGWGQHSDTRGSAGKVREATAGVIELLADQAASSALKHVDRPGFEDSDEEVDVHFSYEEYDLLYRAGRISKDQIRKGKLKRKELLRIRAFLREPGNSTFYPAEDKGTGLKSHDVSIDDAATTIDCGLKRVDSKRYRKDYVIVRDSPQVKRRSWPVRTPSADGTEVVKSTPAGFREEPDSEGEEIMQTQAGVNQDNKARMDHVEENVYISTGQVYDLQDKINQFEEQLSEMTGEASPRELVAMENQVASMSAKVTQSEREVSEIEYEVDQLSIPDQFADRPTDPPTYPPTDQSVTHTSTYTTRVSESPSPGLSTTPTHTLSASLDPPSNGQPEFVGLRLKKLGSTPWEEEQREVERLSQSLPIQSSHDAMSHDSFQQPQNHSFQQGEPAVYNTKTSLSPSQTSSKSQTGPSQTSSKSQTTISKSQTTLNKSQTITTKSQTTKSQTTKSLQGVTEEWSLPESRTEWDEGGQLPSVKSLLSKFSDDRQNSQGDSVRRKPRISYR